jgi:hypothetical protein
MMDYEDKIARWLAGDPGLVAPALSIASRVTGLEDLHPLRVWVANLLFDPGYGVVVEDLLWISNRDGDVDRAVGIRAEVGPVFFSLANWDRVTQMVKAYATKEM